MGTQQLAVFQHYMSQVGKQGWMRASGPYPDNTFAKWAGGVAQGPVPTVNIQQSMSCYESILASACAVGALPQTKVRQLYRSACQRSWATYKPGKDASKDFDWDSMEAWVKRLPDALSEPGKRRGWRRNGSTADWPRTGDLVFFNGAQHVALAVGTMASDGTPQVVSFGMSAAGLRGDIVSVTSVGVLGAAWSGPLEVTFAPPNW
jgi:hypothetical protein